MSGVYNRKLFRQSGARDELRKMGGIMSSSEELMREALMTAMQAPRPADLGPMSMPQQPMGMPAPPVMQPQQPMMQPQQPMDMGMGMQQPMPQQPMDMGMQQPMDDGMGMMQPQSMMPQQPIQPAIAEPAYMPPQMPQSLQMQPAQPVGFQEGGPVIVGAGSKFPRVVGGTSPADSSSINVLEGIDIGQTAGTVARTPSISLGEDLVASAQDLQMRLEDEPPYAVANKILAKAAEKGAEVTGDAQFDLAKIYEQMTGDATAYEKNIDELNRGIIGAAIGAGTSARATENISKGLLVGLEGARTTEERRAGDARSLQLAALQGLVKGTGVDGSGGTEMSPLEPFADAVREMAIALLADGSADSAEQATAMARAALAPLYQGTGGAGTGAAAGAGGGGGLTKVQQDAVTIARQRLEAGTTTPEQVEKAFTSLGIPMEALNE
jgi:hypothetical protein